MALSMPIHRAGRILRGGGVIAYPTEAVYGLGCVPDDLEAVARILDIKDRDPDRGLILIAANPSQLEPWIVMPEDPDLLVSTPERPVTWIVAANPDTPYWITGDNPGVAVRLTTHPVAFALCEATATALVSTSANVSGRPPTRSRFVLRRNFGALVDYIVPGECGPATSPSEIRDFASGRILRPA